MILRNITITKEQAKEISLALDMRANYIETGTIALSALDLKNQSRFEEIKDLRPEQAVLVDNLRSWSKDIRQIHMDILR